MPALTPLRGTLAAMALATLPTLLGAAKVPVEVDCPAGAEMFGASPPAGGERYCRKMLSDGTLMRHGWYTSWYSNGQKAAEGEYVDGERTGIWLRWRVDGSRFEELSFRAGRMDGPYLSWHGTGKPSATGGYREHWQDGHWVFWHENGGKAAEGTYEAGWQQGPWSYWQPGGQLIGTGEYRDSLMLRPHSAAEPASADVSGLAPAAAVAAPGGGPELAVAVDPRIELLSAVLGLTLWPELGPWSDGDTEYSREMRAAFEAFRDHAAVRDLDALVQGGFTFDVPLRWILHYGPPPALELETPLDAYVRRRAGGEKVLSELAAAMRAFARDSRFMAFYDRHRRYYDRLARSYRQAAPRASVPALLERYYGQHKRGYFAVIAPLLGSRPYAFRLGGPAGSALETLYSVAAPQRQRGTDFAFDEDAVQTSLYRDFNRAFTEHAIEVAYGAGYRMDIYSLAKPAMDDLGLVTWRWALSELAVRACEIRLLRMHGYEARARELLREGTDVDRFAWLPYAVERLGEYEGRRDHYPEFGGFAGRLLGILDETDPVTVAGRLMFLLRR